ncbi:hypothetical protein F5051DRAFT_408248, partial [Lentinula edodes]
MIITNLTYSLFWESLVLPLHGSTAVYVRAHQLQKLTPHDFVIVSAARSTLSNRSIEIPQSRFEFWKQVEGQDARIPFYCTLPSAALSLRLERHDASGRDISRAHEILGGN